MAARESDGGDIIKQELEDIIRCCICIDIYTDAKVLPCIHTFCMRCLQETGLKSNKGPGDEMPCPICKRQFKIPPEGFRGLPKNFFIERLIQVAQISHLSATSRAFCYACLEESKEETGKEIPIADAYCVDCKHKLCKECCSDHRKFKLIKNHKIIPINELRESEEILKADLALSVCELHEQKVLDVYCVDCKTVVCGTCFTDDHKSHEGSHVNKFMDGFRKQIENNTGAIEEYSSQALTKKAELLKIIEEMLQKVKNLECEVVERKDVIKEFTDKHADSLLQDLCHIRKSKLKEVQMATSDIDAYLSDLKSYNSYCRRIMAKGSASDICCAVSHLSVIAEELQQQCQSIIEREIQSFKMCLRKSELAEFLEEDCGNLIGQIEAEVRYKSDPVLVQRISWPTKATEEGNKWIQGLTILGEELFVVWRQSSEVEVYDSMKFSFSYRWNLKELIDPKDIGSCNRNKCLYIFDYKGISQSSEILRVDPNGKLINKWSTGDDFGISLSVTDEANIILAISEKNKLNEYSPDGQLIHEINLSSGAGIIYPWHAIKLGNGHFLVSHGDFTNDLNRVCEVDGDGNLKKSFGEKPGSTMGQLHVPEYLAIDGKEFVMVADSRNNRVLLLDSDLEFKRKILTEEKHGLQDPSRILLDQTHNRLFVVDNNTKNKQILIFVFK